MYPSIRGDRSRKFDSMRHGLARFQAIIRVKESIKGFMQKVEDECVWGYCVGRILWCVVDGWNGAGKWRWVFLLLRGSSRGRDPSISVGLAEFFLGVAVWWRGIPRRQLIP